MSIVKINAITVPFDSGDELAKRFAARAGAVDGQPGFEGFELLQPSDGRTTWLVVTRWQDEESFQAWVSGDAFAKAHGHGAPASESAPKNESAESAPSGSSGHSGPVGMSAELWSFDVATGSPGH
ncbi:antibiotic biosynthesis monooxygenase family protein [Dermacoccaceae bacterium W4C1]